MTTARAGLATHVGSAFDTELWTKGGTPVALGALGTLW
ncbi:hypothetical protein QFZ32_005988 [Streptomyces canus]|uniref:Uncharacterized protein n=1 Tax=Streptomyces canus TaxID=58343 RepID=A0AAW8FLX2_9ACTN|nr:hypothetical protein [Streptomyces canus]MDQ0910533.1 hypothetical protein [Streptomyces canus]MDQ1070548.1 hypothetical protein [Streptomyces canus]